MANSEKFCLKWNDFGHNVSSAFNEIREEKDFFDVTLVCDDSQVQAHKVVIAACSPFFKQILKRNPHQHPLLYLKGVVYDNLLSVLHFMYRGEVSIAQDQLNSFLAVAEDLQVKGLTQDGGGGGSEPQKRQESRPVKMSRPRAAAPASSSAATSSHPYQQEEDDEIQEVVNVKTEHGAADNQLAAVEEETYHDQVYDESYQYDDGYSQLGDSSDVAKGTETNNF